MSMPSPPDPHGQQVLYRLEQAEKRLDHIDSLNLAVVVDRLAGLTREFASLKRWLMGLVAALLIAAVTFALTFPAGH